MAVPLHGMKTEDDDEEDTLVEDRQNAGMASVEPDPSLPSNEIKTYPQVSNDENNEKDSSDAGRNELACPRCSKLFKSNNGLKGHLARKFCHSPRVTKGRKSLPSTTDKLNSPANADSLQGEDQDDTTSPSSPAEKKRKVSPLKKNRRKSSMERKGVESVDEESKARQSSSRKKKRQSSSPKNDEQKDPGTRGRIDNSNQDNRPILSCQSCNKTFTSQFGLVYHAKNKVCQVGGKDQEKTENASLNHEPFACSVCSKLFSSKHGYEYHIKKKVCRPGSGKEIRRLQDHTEDPNSEPSKISSPKRHLESTVAKDDEDGFNKDHSVETKQVSDEHGEKSSMHPLTIESNTTHSTVRRNNFGELKPGSMHVTKYGIVKVIADNRLPSVHHKEKLPRVDAVQRFLDYKGSFMCKQRAIAEIMYTGGRMRREQLQKMYLKSIDNESHSTSHGQNSDALSIWSMYCHSMTPHQILHEMMSWKDVNGDLFADAQAELFDREDIRVPRDFYPDRIVECVLVNDERKRICSKHDDDQHNTSALNGASPKMRLFLARKELVARYDKSDPSYICSTCRKSFYDVIAWKYHVNGKLCAVDLISKQEERIRKLEAREEEILDLEGKSKTFLLSAHAVLKQKEVNVEFGNPCKIKQHKKHKMPSWIVFNDHHSSIYPELFIGLKFKRGSQNRNWAGKRKRAEDYVSSHEARLNKKRKQKQVLMSETSVTLDSLRQIHEFALQQAAKQEMAKIERRKRKSVPVPQPPLPVVAPSKLHPPLPVVAHSILPQPLPVIEMSNHMESSHDELLSLEMLDIGKEGNEDGGKSTINNRNEADNPQRENEISTAPPLPGCESLPPAKLVEAGVAKKKTPRKKKQVSKKHLAPNKNEENQNSSSRLPHQPSTEVVDTISIFCDNVADPCSQAITVPTTTTVPPENDNKSTPLDTETCIDGDNEGVKVFYKKNKLNPVVIDTQVLVAECDAGRYPTITRFDGAHLTECVLCTRTGADEEDPLIECDFCKNAAHQICISKKMLNKEPPIILRELEPHDSFLCHDCVAYCLARRTRAESRRVSKWHYELSRVGLAHPDAAYLAEEVEMGESDDNITDKKQDDSPTYAPCPNGGPGGLICCSHCSAAYSRYLSNTAKEMEAQSIAKVGQEVNDILDLLADAKRRLLSATDVNHSNEIRRKLLSNNEV